ncbi:hypothetical protein DH2020_003613 [Rehmannia glutinosa]|uniref:DUF7792 domain-containing protein n=1 Tax=Rehmannia glutinosa TaxID=99300 RepID=A0ABR0XM25_REHGL
MATKPTSSSTALPAIHQKQHPQKQAAIEQQEKRIEDVLSFPILLSDQINQAVKEAEIFKFGCSEVGEKVESLCQMLRSAARLATSSPGATFYDRPLRRVAAEVSKNLEKSVTVVRKCRRRSIFSRVVTIVSAADFRKLLNLLKSSVADMEWVLSIFEAGGAAGGIVLTLPPIASTDPIISWVWSFIASLHMGQLQDKIEAANQLSSLAKDNDRNKQIIVEEGGILPLLKMLKDGSSLDGRIAAACALYNLANNVERVRAIIDALGVPIIVHVLGDSPMKREDFARENVIRPLVTLLSFDLSMDDPKLKFGKQSIHSIVHKEMEMKNLYNTRLVSSSSSFHYSEGSSKGGTNRKDRENEKPEVKIGLKISCAEALWMLAKESVPNSKRITDTKGLLCLAKLTNSPAKAVVDQLLRVIKDSDNPRLSVAAVRAIGSLARTFPARETRVIGPLVEQLSHRNQDSIIEFRGVPPIMRLLRGNERAQLHGLILVCYLAIHAGKSDDLERAGVLNAFEGVERAIIAQHHKLRELIPQAIYHLSVFHQSHSGMLAQRPFLAH